MNRYEATKETHHDAEQTPFGQEYSKGTLSRQSYTDWIFLQLTIHSLLDPLVPYYVQRAPYLMQDLAELLPCQGRSLKAAEELVKPFFTDVPAWALSAAYILNGAHLRGGQVVRKTLEPAGFPTHHLDFEDEAKAREWLRQQREHTHLAETDVLFFKGMIKAMDEIYALNHGAGYELAV